MILLTKYLYCSLIAQVRADITTDSLINSRLYILNVVVEVGFLETSYAVEEAQNFVELSVELRGRIERPIFVTLSIECVFPPGWFWINIGSIGFFHS